MTSAGDEHADGGRAVTPVIEERVHVTPVPVRFGDTDRFGHVNNAAYATYVEIARIAMITGLDHPLGGMILAHLAIDYRRQLHVGDPLVVLSRATAIGRTSIRLAQALVRPDDAGLAHGPGHDVPLAEAPTGERIADVASVIVTYDYAAERPVPVPEALRARLAPFLGPLPGA
ncbi:MAG: thioesterase family protein [Trueperaceae bacterium]|nr:thioesterase family protein [Trueperaceae bacterium]